MDTFERQRVKWDVRQAFWFYARGIVLDARLGVQRCRASKGPIKHYPPYSNTQEQRYEKYRKKQGPRGNARHLHALITGGSRPERLLDLLKRREIGERVSVFYGPFPSRNGRAVWVLRLLRAF
jgi:hypothetical protein